jgi:acetolactate synthase-1/2/3 large subunit
MMGFGLPAALGAKAVRPRSTVICVDGDGSFEMTLQELHTSLAERLPVIVVIVNNGHLGRVRQWQDMFYDERLSQVDLSAAMPDFAALARGYGALGFTAHSARELDAALDEGLRSGRTAILDVRVDPTERCYPMISPGGAAVDMVEWSGT